ncbi:MAG: tetratricopeptide repeat protein [Candidatus Omnitrophica bacterium]|nr:tetratricopeptide repeat protein [Candidatus Omnitrophota bacterium]
MRKVLCAVMIAVIAFTGCAKKDTTPKNVQEARKFLVAGMMLLKQAEPIKAVESFANAIKVAPEYFESYYVLAETFIHLKQYPQAISILNAAGTRFPTNGYAYYLLAIAEEGAGQTIPAIVAARKSMELMVAAKDEQGMKRATILVAALIASAKQESEDKAVANAEKDAKAAPKAAPVVAAPTIAVPEAVEPTEVK